MDFFDPFVFAFLPIGVITLVITFFSYRKGKVRPEDDRKDDWDIGGGSYENRPSHNFLHAKWVTYGGGYYGLLVLITFFYIEAKELYGLALIYDQLPDLIMELDRDSVRDIIRSQVMNMVDGFVWFQYWPEQIEMDNGWIWLAFSYAGYTTGHNLATHLLPTP